MVSHVGMVHPMYCSGVGKAIMATLPDEEVKKIWKMSIADYIDALKDGQDDHGFLADAGSVGGSAAEWLRAGR